MFVKRKLEREKPDGTAAGRDGGNGLSRHQPVFGPVPQADGAVSNGIFNRHPFEKSDGDDFFHRFENL